MIYFALAHISNVDMQFSHCGENNECHSYFACVEAGPDLERSNVRYLPKFSYLVAFISLIATPILLTCVNIASFKLMC